MLPRKPIDQTIQHRVLDARRSVDAEELSGGSFAKRVFIADKADAVFVSFFATLSAEMQLGMAKGAFRKKVGNEDYERQREVVDFVQGTNAWKRLEWMKRLIITLGIFSLIPSSQHLPNSLVCKRWLALHCRLRRSLKLLNWHFLDSDSLISRFPDLTEMDLCPQSTQNRCLPAQLLPFLSFTALPWRSQSQQIALFLAEEPCSCLMETT